MTARVLFVDDEQRILDGIRRLLHGRRDAWDMVFCTSPSNAIAECERSPFDIVVSDMRMPGIDGATLLTTIADRWPGTVRMVLSGQTHVTAAMRASRVAHQFLTKPCDPATLQSVLERACALRDLITDPILEEIVGGLGALPPVPTVYQSLTALLAKEDVSTSEVTAIVRQDASLSAKTLHLANSSFFGPSRQVSSIEHAVSLLGSRLIQSLALSHGVYRSIGEHALPAGFDPRAEQAHAIAVAGLASRMVDDRRDADTAFSAGLLHDLGRLLLATRKPERFAAVLTYADEHDLALSVAERSVLRTTHAELGACLLGVWGLPWPIVGAARYHHAPGFDPDSAVTLRVHVADALIRELESDVRLARRFPASLDDAVVKAAGLEPRIAEWRELAGTLATDPSS